MLSADGANKKPLMPLAHTDYMSSNVNSTSKSSCSTGFANFDFQQANIDFDCFLPNANGPTQTGQISPSSAFPTEWNSQASDPSTYADFSYNHLGQYSQLASSGFFMGASKQNQYGCIDFESLQLQQKVSLKKQSLDILQGVMPDPLGLEAHQEKRAYMTNTERIQVPSSDHVAEIVGKNGQRIKQLREQLKVWIKTPSRDEPPIFEVTGLPEKLAEAKSHILRMSEHFTKVQQERMQRVEPNRIEDRLYVEQDKVGLIVGANGQTIRWVQQLSDTHIATPRKQESLPGVPPPQTYFTICGATDKVKFAKQLICEYVTLRCQGLWLDPDLAPSAEASKLVRDFHQRRQVEDTQRKVAPAPANPMPAGPTNTVVTSGVSVIPVTTIDAASKYAMPTRLPPNSSDYASGGVPASLASVRQLISDMDDMWSRPSNSCSESATANSMLSAAANANPWYPMSMYNNNNNNNNYGTGPVSAALASMGDRRYSSADLTTNNANSNNGYSNVSAASMMSMGGVVGDGDFSGGYMSQPGLLEAGTIKKSQSEERVSPNLVGPGWL